MWPHYSSTAVPNTQFVCVIRCVTSALSSESSEYEMAPPKKTLRLWIWGWSNFFSFLRNQHLSILLSQFPSYWSNTSGLKKKTTTTKNQETLYTLSLICKQSKNIDPFCFYLEKPLFCLQCVKTQRNRMILFFHSVRFSRSGMEIKNCLILSLPCKSCCCPRRRSVVKVLFSSHKVVVIISYFYRNNHSLNAWGVDNF